MTSTKIENVTIEKVKLPLDEPFTIAIGTKYSIENAIITIRLENGITGYGEAAPLEPVNGENLATAMATLESCREYLIGKDVSDYVRISRHLKSVFWAQVTARCAIEMALLDALTRSLGIPLYKFFGGLENTLETDYTVDIVSAETARKNASRLAKKGYRVLKTKVGKSLTDDIDRILAIIDGAPGCGITLDANQGFSPPEAVYFLQELEKNKIRPVMFEQPVIKSDLAGMKFVKDHTSIPIGADESVFTSADAINIVRTGCADVINIKLMKSGLVEAMDIAAIARSANIQLMVGCMIETKLALGCAVHFAAGTGGFRFIDLDPHLNPEQEPFTGGPEFRDPVYRLEKYDRYWCGTKVRCEVFLVKILPRKRPRPVFVIPVSFTADIKLAFVRHACCSIYLLKVFKRFPRFRDWKDGILLTMNGTERTRCNKSGYISHLTKFKDSRNIIAIAVGNGANTSPERAEIGAWHTNRNPGVAC